MKAGSVTTNVTIANGDTVQKVMDALNADGTGIRAEIGSDNKLKISALNGESLEVLTLRRMRARPSSASPRARLPAPPPRRTPPAESLAKQFDDLRTQIDQLSKDSGFNGVNLIAGDSLKVQFNEANTSSLTIKGVSYNSSGLGIPASTNSWQADSDINAGLTSLNKAIDGCAPRRPPSARTSRSCRTAGFHQGPDRHAQRRR